MIVTREDLRNWRVGKVMYRWFLRRFPEGGSYADVHRALSRDGYIDWANSLVEYAWSRWIDEENFVRQDIFAMSSPMLPDVVTSGRQIANAADNARLGCADDNMKIASVGYAAQIASAGDCVRLGSMGYNSHISSSGDRARIAAAGNSTRISSAGNGTRIASSGMRVRVSAVGERSHIASNGDLTQIVSFGASARIANSGDNVHIICNGDNAVIASTGMVDAIVLGPGGCAALAYHDGERMRFAVAVEGEKGIRAGVKYRLDDTHQFVEC
ncbi:hypothetical protein INP82_03790 [Citrobacter sedlakii]|uniref:protein YdhT n=1 Tax=Citrobacter TaxID=544 RepID=UPI001969BB18|nr:MULTISPECIES: protein YdhT [Citrobacter]MBM9566550.1 hypothetical protein [Citrobacter sedlakii]HBL4689359.1 hypothetical protein [Citrobacter sedlakii]HBL4703798.1 hypothetical protein [Citrobacter sedlakii]HBL4717896.1 hypothetical protein [Citrobacter sedlakii]HBL4722254.1 hypothetical protein [Citrobacter sedlakii]